MLLLYVCNRLTCPGDYSVIPNRRDRIREGAAALELDA